MGLREFVDEKGVRWQVWATRPPEEAARTLAAELRAGWLTFEAGPIRRRLAPIPGGWDGMSDERLGRLCASARPMPPRPRLIE
jgi:hypothetical protein